MSVYVDDARAFAPHLLGGRARWSHLTADSKEELHAFAAQLGLARSWFQNDNRLWHYDVVDRIRQRAILLGAIPVTTRELVAISVERIKAERGRT